MQAVTTSRLRLLPALWILAGWLPQAWADECQVCDTLEWFDAMGEGLFSFDPNEVVGPPGVGTESERFVLPGERHTYIIYFENKATATAAAQEVFITNPLDPSFDLETFSLGEVVFHNQAMGALAGQRGGVGEVPHEAIENLHVIVEMELDEDTRTARWYLRCLDPRTRDWPEDPYVGFLPPNDETHRGEGHVTYSVRTRPDLADGVRVRNRASIVFDTNAPIITNEWSNTIGSGPPGAPLPSSPPDGSEAVPLTAPLTWSAAPLATTYALYLWRDGESAPLEPTVSGMSSTLYRTVRPWETDTRYHWRVEAVNAFGTSPGTEQSFRTESGLRYSLTVVGGAGSGTYRPAATVPVVPEPPAGHAFDSWSGDTSHLDDPGRPHARVTMPAWDITVEARFLPYVEAWAEAMGVPSGQREANDCPAGDGIPNLLKYATGLDPLAPVSPRSLCTITFAADGSRSFLEFLQARDARDVTITPLWSTDLETWHDEGVLLESLGSDGALERLRASVAVPSGERLFWSLRAAVQ